MGAVGGLLFMFACLPMAYKTIKSGQAVVTDRLTIWTFVSALLTFGTYLVSVTGLWNVPSISMIIELLSWCVVAFYSYFPGGFTGAPIGIIADKLKLSRGD